MSETTRITMNIDPTLKNEAVAAADVQGITMTGYVIRAVEQSLTGRAVILPPTAFTEASTLAAEKGIGLEELLAQAVATLASIKPVELTEAQREKAAGNTSYKAPGSAAVRVDAGIDKAIANNIEAQNEGRMNDLLWLTGNVVAALCGSGRKAVNAGLEARQDEIAEHHKAMGLESAEINMLNARAQKRIIERAIERLQEDGKEVTVAAVDKMVRHIAANTGGYPVSRTVIEGYIA